MCVDKNLKKTQKTIDVNVANELCVWCLWLCVIHKVNGIMENFDFNCLYFFKF